MLYSEAVKESKKAMKLYMNIVDQRPKEFNSENEYKKHCIKELDADLRMCCGARDVLRFRDLELQDSTYVTTTSMKIFDFIKNGIKVLEIDFDLLPVDEFGSRVEEYTTCLRKVCEVFKEISERSNEPTEDVELDDLILGKK